MIRVEGGLNELPRVLIEAFPTLLPFSLSFLSFLSLAPFFPLFFHLILNPRTDNDRRGEKRRCSSLTSARFAFENRLDICLMNNHHSPGLGQIGRRRVNISLSLSICPPSFLPPQLCIFSYKISRGKSFPIPPVVGQRNEEQAKRVEEAGRISMVPSSIHLKLGI